MVLTTVCSLSLQAWGTDDIFSTLKDTGCYRAEATFSVNVPQTDTDVTYTLSLESAATPSDPLSPASYLIDWSFPSSSGTSTGFTAYFAGNLYRYRDSRLMEYHTQWDSVPFLGTERVRPVQLSAQFADLLPQFIGVELEKLKADTACSLTITPDRTFNGSPAVEIRAVAKLQDTTVQEKTYILDAATLLPIRTVTESNPGSITEQTIIVDYRTAASPQCRDLSEQLLADTYPEVFEKYRISNFSIENLRGTSLPDITLPTLTGQRYTHLRGDPFALPTVIAIIDPGAGSCFNPQLISALRSAADSASSPSSLILAFAGTNADMAEEISGGIRPGETVLLNARSLARDCGAASLPVILISDSRGTVRNVLLGFNNNITEVVIQSLELIK